MSKSTRPKLSPRLEALSRPRTVAPRREETSRQPRPTSLSSSRQTAASTRAVEAVRSPTLPVAPHLRPRAGTTATNTRPGHGLVTVADSVPAVSVSTVRAGHPISARLDALARPRNAAAPVRSTTSRLRRSSLASNSSASTASSLRQGSITSNSSARSISSNQTPRQGRITRIVPRSTRAPNTVTSRTPQRRPSTRGSGDAIATGSSSPSNESQAHETPLANNARNPEPLVTASPVASQNNRAQATVTPSFVTPIPAQVSTDIASTPPSPIAANPESSDQETMVVAPSNTATQGQTNRSSAHIRRLAALDIEHRELERSLKKLIRQREDEIRIERSRYEALRRRRLLIESIAQWRAIADIPSHMRKALRLHLHMIPDDECWEEFARYMYYLVLSIIHRTRKYR